MTDIAPMRSHAPGWTLDLSTRDEDGEVTATGARYMVWAPQTDIIRDPRFPGMWSTTADGVGWYEDARPPRDHWAACWQSGDGKDGNFVEGQTADEVLASFPDQIAKRFRAALS